MSHAATAAAAAAIVRLPVECCCCVAHLVVVAVVAVQYTLVLLLSIQKCERGGPILLRVLVERVEREIEQRIAMQQLPRHVYTSLETTMAYAYSPLRLLSTRHHPLSQRKRRKKKPSKDDDDDDDDGYLINVSPPSHCLFARGH